MAQWKRRLNTRWGKRCFQANVPQSTWAEAEKETGDDTFEKGFVGMSPHSSSFFLPAHQSTAVNNQNANEFRFSKQAYKTSWAPVLLFLDTHIEQKSSNGHAEKKSAPSCVLSSRFHTFSFLLQSVESVNISWGLRCWCV